MREERDTFLRIHHLGSFLKEQLASLKRNKLVPGSVACGLSNVRSCVSSEEITTQNLKQPFLRRQVFDN